MTSAIIDGRRGGGVPIRRQPHAVRRSGGIGRRAVRTPCDRRRRCPRRWTRQWPPARRHFRPAGGRRVVAAARTAEPARVVIREPKSLQRRQRRRGISRALQELVHSDNRNHERTAVQRRQESPCGTLFSSLGLPLERDKKRRVEQDRAPHRRFCARPRPCRPTRRSIRAAPLPSQSGPTGRSGPGSRRISAPSCDAPSAPDAPHVSYRASR